ncbi:MAG: hypothetical protein QOJ39_2916 [Candidatus Eremiobacteraeota bacterium]|nr:hypothetical protein [Candidatus Eremiobacteraeota bacterium]
MPATPIPATTLAPVSVPGAAENRAMNSPEEIQAAIDPSIAGTDRKLVASVLSQLPDLPNHAQTAALREGRLRLYVIDPATNKIYTNRPSSEGSLAQVPAVAGKPDHYWLYGRDTLFPSHSASRVATQARKAGAVSRAKRDRGVNQYGTCGIGGSGLGTGIIRRTWSNPGFREQIATVSLPTNAQYIDSSNSWRQSYDTGYVYMGGYGSQCANVEGGFIYSKANNWFTQYMRFAGSFGHVGGSTDLNYVYSNGSGVSCNGQPTCTNFGRSRVPGQYDIAFYSTVTGQCGSNQTNCLYNNQLYFASYPHNSSGPMLLVSMLGPTWSQSLNTSWNGWSLQCGGCVMIRETNIAQNGGVNNDVNEYFGPIAWNGAQLYKEQLDGTFAAPWQGNTQYCETWDGDVDDPNTCNTQGGDNIVEVAWSDYANETVFISPFWTYQNGQIRPYESTKRSVGTSVPLPPGMPCTPYDLDTAGLCAVASASVDRYTSCNDADGNWDQYTETTTVYTVYDTTGQPQGPQFYNTTNNPGVPCAPSGWSPSSPAYYFNDYWLPQ